MNTKTEEILKELNKIIVGKEAVLEKTLMAILSRGHILLDDVPGVGKTTLALACSKVLGLDYHRIQFTPDVVPSDIIGFSMYNKESGTFEYKPGVVMTNLLLADEINRTSSKTQSALLEVMEEGKVTVDGITHKMPDPYIVIATQNPVGSIGTQMLPESQMDRFIVRLTMGYPNLESEVAMLKSKQNLVPVDNVRPVVSAEDILQARKVVENIYVSDQVFQYIVMLANATRNNEYIKLGLSPRGTIALLRMTKATALLKGRDYVIPDDVIYSFKDVVLHRLVFSSKAKINGFTGEQILKGVISSVQVPRVSK